MKKFGIMALALLVAAGAVAQDEFAVEKQPLKSRMAEKGILNHLDVGVNVGSVGIGLDVAMPIGDYVRVRAGYNYIPRFSMHSDFSIETRSGSIDKYLEKIKTIDIDKKMEEVGVDFSDESFSEYRELFEKFRNVEIQDHITMALKPSVHQFKFLVDVLPFKNNKHWSFTAGFFAGPSEVGDATSLSSQTLLLEAVTAYNDLYVSYCGQDFPAYHQKLDELFYKSGIAGVPLGYFANGDKAMMVPAKDGTVRAEMKVNKVRPYFGFGYNTALARDKKWKLNVDAGILVLGKPSINVNNVYKIDESIIDIDNYCYDILRPNEDWTEFIVDKPLRHVDLVRDLHDIPGKVGDMTRTLSKFKVYPNVSATFSYRLF